MSRFSGKCDLFDSIFGGTEDWKDYFKRFEDFKKRTSGVLHQERKVLVTESNLDDICRMNNKLVYSNHSIEKKNAKGETKLVLQKFYYYWDKEYDSLKKLNKHGVYVMIDIPFDTILDLIPYYPYVIACHYFSEEKEMVILAHESFVDQTIDDRLESGWFDKDSIDFQWHYKHELQEHYRDVLAQLFYDIGDRRVQFSLKDIELKKDGDHYLVSAPEGKAIDPNFPVKWFFSEETKTHWTDPKRVDDSTISIHEKDVEGYLKDAIENNGVQVEYVKRRNW